CLHHRSRYSAVGWSISPGCRWDRSLGPRCSSNVQCAFSASDFPAARIVSQSIGPDRPHRRTGMFWEVLRSFPNCLLYWLAFSLTRCAALAEIRNRRREEDGREPSQVYQQSGRWEYRSPDLNVVNANELQVTRKLRQTRARLSLRCFFGF